MGGGGEQFPLLKDSSTSSHGIDRNFKRTGTVWTAVAHIITAVIGSGVLSLAWSTAQLGWVAGPLAMVLFAALTLTSSTLLADCYRSPHPEHGPIRSHSYMDAVRLNLGNKSIWVSGFFQNVGLYGGGVAYTITTGSCIRAILRSNCFHREGHKALCAYGDSFYMLLFGAVQLFVSQIPDFHNMGWLSILASIMSFSYSSIGFGLGLAKVIGNGMIKGSIGGISTATASEKVWKVFQALGDIAFAYPYSIILIEIEDTLKSPPPENQTMKKASTIAILITTFFYLCCGCLGYAAFGDETPGNLLTGFGFYEPYWLIDFANACVVLHLIGGYQVYSQAVFAFAERSFAEWFPENAFINDFYMIPFAPSYKTNLFRLCFRTMYVVSTTCVGMLFPYFNQVLGLIGAISFWPIAIYFPVEMYSVKNKIGAWTGRWVALQSFSIVSLLISLAAFVGSVVGLISKKLS
ncbi:putative amino acid permease 7 [Acorus calamus]|uniref:Amino acid permease 7 n=1 Tax=Acorus calamus TaxID=4465 RepID=A0AAV9D8A1_ACOCL|nr:putative amino acid permease 7 [Acorus calamus]